MEVNKLEPTRAALCASCEHQPVAGDQWPCNCCWNPLGDMYRPRAPLTPKDDAASSAYKEVDVKVERAAFEAWASPDSSIAHLRRELGYVHNGTQTKWNAWKARAGLAASHPIQPAPAFDIDNFRKELVDALTGNGFSHSQLKLVDTACLVLLSEPATRAPDIAPVGQLNTPATGKGEE